MHPVHRQMATMRNQSTQRRQIVRIPVTIHIFYGHYHTVYMPDCVICTAKSHHFYLNVFFSTSAVEPSVNSCCYHSKLFFDWWWNKNNAAFLVWYLSCYFRSLPCGIKRGTLTFSISAFFTCTNVIFSDGSHIPPSAEACFFFSAGRVEVFEAEIPKHNTRKKSSFTSSLTDYERLL